MKFKDAAIAISCCAKCARTLGEATGTGAAAAADAVLLLFLSHGADGRDAQTRLRRSFRWR